MQLNDRTFFLYALKNYDNPKCNSQEDFEEDLLRFKYLKKTFFVYKKKGDLKERLIFNHLMILYNAFKHEACTDMLIYKMDNYLDCLFPFLLTMGYVDAELIAKHCSSMDVKIVSKIRDILKEYKKE